MQSCTFITCTKLLNRDNHGKAWPRINYINNHYTKIIRFLQKVVNPECVCLHHMRVTNLRWKESQTDFITNQVGHSLFIRVLFIGMSLPFCIIILGS